eukprot:TRINITY_DN3097_c0_g1_i3.p2 TRINITY_DN3097_c0_g1~~TRINITY_DN3097_c0_g1_i3.p2  ORF type:complete len:100 (+),score=23.09 TRINITY_DN3097_c0_g1_i3:197-496(+)
MWRGRLLASRAVTAVRCQTLNPNAQMCAFKTYSPACSREGIYKPDSMSLPDEDTDEELAHQPYKPEDDEAKKKMLLKRQEYLKQQMEQLEQELEGLPDK